MIREVPWRRHLAPREAHAIGCRALATVVPHPQGTGGAFWARGKPTTAYECSAVSNRGYPPFQRGHSLVHLAEGSLLDAETVGSSQRGASGAPMSHASWCSPVPYAP